MRSERSAATAARAACEPLHQARGISRTYLEHRLGQQEVRRDAALVALQADADAARFDQVGDAPRRPKVLRAMPGAVPPSDTRLSAGVGSVVT